ncbi:MAG: hypothetical protein C4548_01640, partial [Desulfobacteraceae bacterium]
MRQTYVKITCLILISFLALFGSGCGESGNPGGVGGIGVTASISLSAGDISIPADGVTSTIITAFLADSSNAPVYERTSVVFRTTRGTFRNGSQEYKVKIPDASGTVSVTLIADSSPGTAKISAEANDISQKIEVKFFDPSKVGTITLRTGAASITADGTSRVAVIATVADNLGNPEEGAQVTFKTTLGEFVEVNPLPGIINRTTLADTDVDGEAAVMLVSGKTIGTATILASINGLNATATVIFTPDEPKTMTLRAAPSTIRPNGTSTLFARLLDANGNPVEGRDVVFSQAVNVTEGTLNILTAPTNVNGEAQATYTAGKDPGTDILQAALAGNLDMRAQTSILVDPAAIVIASIDVTTGAASLVADGKSKVKVRALVTDIEGNPAIGKTVTFTTTAGTIPATALTSELGYADVMLQASTVSGPVKVRAECDGFIDEADMQFVPGPAHHIIMYAFPNTVPPNGPFQTAAIVQDEYDNRIDDQRLMLQVRRAGYPEIVDTAEMTPEQAEDGVYRFDWTAARAYGEGNLEITARVNAPDGKVVSKTVTVVVDETATIVGAINVIAGAEEIKADGTSSVLIRATVLDYDGNPAQGVKVKFYTTLGSFSSAQKETDANGIADVMLRAGTTWGTATVTADANGFWGKVDVRFTSLKAGGVTLTAMPAIVAPGGQATLIAELRDANGAPVANETLYFDLFENNTLGSIGEDCSCPDCVTSTSVVATTDVNGRAIIQYCAGINPPRHVTICGCHGDRVRVTLASDSTVKDEICICVVVPTGLAGYMTLKADSNSLPADGISSTAITATIFDTAGVPMPRGTPITFTVEPSGCATFPGGVDEITLDTIDDSGTVITSLIAGNSPCVATIVARSGGLSQVIYVIIDDGLIQVGSITLTANPPSIPADGASSSAITATVLDNSNNPVPDGTPVIFDTTLGTWINTPLNQQVVLATTGGTVTTSLIAGLDDGIAFVTVTAGSKTQAIEVPILETVTGGLALTANPTTLVADGTSTSLIRATMTDNGGNPMPGVAVNFATTLGTLSAASATTNASGIADVILTSGTTTGTAVVTANASGYTASVNVTFTSGAPMTIDMTASCLVLSPLDGQCATGECKNQSKIIATLRDTQGNPMPGQTIAFTIDPNQSGATLSAPSAVTDINGQATVTYTAGPNNGDDTVIATSVTDTTITGVIDIVVGGQVTLTASDDPIIADGLSTSTFTATVRNNAGSPMEGIPVIFKNITGTAAGFYSGTGPDITPNFYHSGGLITFKLTHGGNSNFIVWLKNNNGNNVELLVNTIGSVSEQTKAFNLDPGVYFAAVEQADVSWTIEVESADPVFDTLPTLLAATTDAGGQASYIYTSTTSAQAVKIGIKASCVQASATIQQIPGPPDTLQLNAAPNPVHPTSQVTLTAIVKDAYGNPIEGETINFAVTANNSGGSLVAISDATDSAGRAVVTYMTGATNGVTDSFSATCTTNGTTGTASVDIDASAVMVGGITVTAGTNSMPADGTSETLIRATVRDTGGNPVPNIAVVFTTTSGTILSTPVITGANGVAQTTLRSSTFSGTATVTAVAGGYWATVNVAFTPGVPRTITLNAAPSTVNPGGVSTVTATLRDVNNNRVPGETITFLLTQNNSGATLSAPSAVTNILGQATISYTAGNAAPATDRIRARSVTDTSITDFVDIDVDATAIIVGGVTVVSGASSLVANGTSTTAIR